MFRKLLKITGAAAASVLLISSAGAAQLATRFDGWVGKQQRSQFIDASSWHYCYSNQGGSCGSVALTTGHSACVTRGFNIGTKWAIPTRIGGLEMNSGYNNSWTACNIRSETVTCSPNVGWHGRAAILFSERVANITVTGGDPDYYVTQNSSCPSGWTSRWDGGSRWSCRYTGFKGTVSGYYPEWRGSTCDYQRN